MFHGGVLHVPWRGITCSMEGYYMFHGGYNMLHGVVVHVPWRAITCSMGGITCSMEVYYMSHGGIVHVPWRDITWTFILFKNIFKRMYKTFTIVLRLNQPWNL